MEDVLREAERVAARAEAKAEQLRRENLVFRYIMAFVRGDFDAMVAIWAEAEPEPALANLLYQVADDLAREEAQRLGIGEEDYAQAHAVVQRVLREWKEQR
jgi:hypothetical protein